MGLDIVNFWKGKKVWVSGATGAWGREIVKQALEFDIDRVVCFCRGEHRAYNLREETNDGRVQIYLGDIRDGGRVERSLKGVDVAIHTAALKRVDAFTYSPTEIQDVNINGTIRIIEGIIKQGVGHAFYISSDKACLPTTYYGATKFVAEQLWLSARDLGPKFIAARFGNALGSTGSVLEVWRKQLLAGNCITITDPTMTRYLITLPEVVEQILIHLIPHGITGEAMYADMPAATIGAMAKAFAPHASWNVIGSRGYGEKHHEVLTIDGKVSSETARRLTHEELVRILKPYR